MRREADAPIASAFGDLLREYRVRAGLSQSDLAERARLSPAAVSALERGIRRAPYRSTVSLLAEALNLSAEEASSLQDARRAGRSKPAKSAVPHNLHAERTSFVGRDADIADVIKLLDRSRLVTITGSGGIGKTRVAIEAAAQLLGHPRDETWFIDLAPLTDGELIASKVAYTIQPALSGNAGSIESLASALAKRSMFLILDNCEHVIAHAAKVADEILDRCPQVTVLATSRERLNVAGEFVYRLSSLLLPPDVPTSLEKARAYSAVDLFIQRSEALAPHLTFDSKSLPAVIDIVRRLDGIPLAIELTAAQVPLLGIDTVRERLDQEFTVPSGRRDLPARQQTVNAAIRWSFDLLTAEEQNLLCDVSIFTGGFTLEAAEGISGGTHGTDSHVVAHLSSLADKSLVNMENVGGNVRYSLLESVKAFGLARLHEKDRYTALARRHAQWFASVADRLEMAILSHEDAVSLVPDIENIRSAIAWSLDASSQDDRTYSGRIISGFSDIWDCIGRPRERQQLLDDAIKRIDESLYPVLMATLLKSFILNAQRDPVVLERVDHAIQLCERFGSERAKAHLHVVLTAVLAMHGRLVEADRSAERVAVLLRLEECNDNGLKLAFLANRHDLRMAQHRFDEAREDLLAAEALALALGERLWVVCHCYSRYSTLEYVLGNKRLALEYAERIMSSEFRSYAIVGQSALERLAILRIDLGDLDGASQSLRELLTCLPVGETTMVSALEITALYLAVRGHGNLAAKLRGFVHGVIHDGFRRNLMKQESYNCLGTLLQQQLNSQQLAAAESEGSLMTAEEVYGVAIDALQ